MTNNKDILFIFYILFYKAYGGRGDNRERVCARALRAHARARLYVTFATLGWRGGCRCDATKAVPSGTREAFGQG